MATATKITVLSIYVPFNDTFHDLEIGQQVKIKRAVRTANPLTVNIVTASKQQQRHLLALIN